MTRPEDEARFSRVVSALGLIAQMVPSHDDLDFVARELEKADAFGVFTDPTAWRKSTADRDALSNLVLAALPLATAAEMFVALGLEQIAARQGGGGP